MNVFCRSRSSAVDAAPPDTPSSAPSSPGSHTPLRFRSVAHRNWRYHVAEFGLMLLAKSAPGYSQNCPKLAFTSVFASPVRS
ncbi:MAG: hypothetical protein DMG01_09020 [Acidobacteria bacterium]|nr:MAG: hypothetical protein DMG01_09020 [Acidobacteriota bacterium]